MRLHRMLYLMVIACSVLLLAAEAQKKPPQAAPKKQITPAQNRIQPGQLQPASEEQNKAVVRRVFDDLFTRGRYEFINQIYTQDCAVHLRNQTNRLEEAVAEGKGWRSAAPDLVMTVNRMVAQGDIVTVDWTA